MRWLLAILITLSTAAAAADEAVRAEQPDPTDVDVLELDPIEVTGEGFSFQQEVTLRVVRRALEQPRSESQADRDVWLCWLEEETGTHFNHLNCARNGDLWALRPTNGLTAQPLGMGGYGKILRSERPVNKYKLDQALAALPGNDAFDEEFLALALAGEQPPRDIPDEAELEKFAQAYYQVERLARRGRSEDRQIAAITEQGLSLDRYNRIVDLVKTYQSIEDQVAERLKQIN